MQYRYPLSSPLGGITLTSDGEALTGLWFEGGRHFPDLSAAAERALPVFRETETWLGRYFRGEAPGALPPLCPGGTPFQRAVWDLLLTIPYGETTTYGALARELARRRGIPRMAAQAVGQAVGRNPISILIPCHRVLGAGGSLTGYGGGLDRKRWLLALEQSDSPGHGGT